MDKWKSVEKACKIKTKIIKIISGWQNYIWPFFLLHSFFVFSWCCTVNIHCIYNWKKSVSFQLCENFKYFKYFWHSVVQKNLCSKSKVLFPQTVLHSKEQGPFKLSLVWYLFYIIISYTILYCSCSVALWILTRMAFKQMLQTTLWQSTCFAIHFGKEVV